MNRVSQARGTGRTSQRARARLSRSAGALVISMLLVAAAAGSVSARPVGGPALSVTMQVTTRDCQAVTINYVVEWWGLPPPSDPGASTIALRTNPGGHSLLVSDLDLGKKADRPKGKVKGQLVRESGYFDSQTYPTWSYQLVVSVDNSTIEASSNVEAIPSCVPMTPVTGPASGATLVTVFGGGTFGGPSFTMQSTVTIGGLIAVTPTQVAADGTWLTFMTPPGPANTCQTVMTNPSVPFALPSFCYGA